MADVSDTLDRLSRWLTAGPIQEAQGGIFAWCDHHLVPSYVYPEVTGYMLTALASGIAPIECSRTRAMRCAQFLKRRVALGQLGARPQEDTVIYNFDQGVIATGLMRAHAKFGAQTLAEALQLAKLLRDQILNERRLPTWCDQGSVPERGRKWSTAGALHLVKCTQALLLARDHGLEAAAEAADLLAQHTLALLRAMAVPATCPGDPEIHFHAVLYCAEGMWIYGTATGAKDALDCSRALLGYVLEEMDDAGTLTAVAGGGGYAPEQGDVVAQMLRLALLHGRPADLVKLIYARLRRFFRAVEAWTAVEYQLGSSHLNSWATIFAAQACLLMHDPGRHFDWRDLA